MFTGAESYGAQVITLATVNALNLYDDHRSTERVEVDRWTAVEALIRSLDADVIAVQEIVARPAVTPDDPPVRVVAEDGLRRLAAAVDRECVDRNTGTVALAVGGGGLHCGLLWREGISPAPGSVARYERDPHGMWHSMVTAVLDVDGRMCRVGSVQLSPFDPGVGWGWRDAGQVLRAMHRDHIPGLVGGDWNGIGASVTYDPDPYLGVPWHPDHAYQRGPDGHLDRSTARRLEIAGGMRDVAPLLAEPWSPTTGHHPADPHPPRRIDRWYATHHLPDRAILGYRVADPYAADTITDHLPVLVTLDPAALA